MRMKAFDGRTYTVYQIEGQFPDTASRQYKNYWCTRQLTPRHFGERHAKHGEDWDKVSPYYKAYGACGDCWQKTGMDGFLDQSLAMKAFVRLMKFAPPTNDVVQWRLVSRRITVELEVIATCRAPLVTS